MQTKKYLKTQLEFNKSIEGIISVLKMSTAIQLRQTQAKTWTKEIMAKELKESYALFSHKQLKEHKLVALSNSSPKGIIVVTSDEGFLGELNALLINAALNEKKNKEDEIIVLGEKGGQYLREAKESFLYFPEAMGKSYYQLVSSIKKFVLERFERGLFKQIVIVYADFVSIGARQIKVSSLLPFPLEAMVERFAKKQKPITIEPSADKAIDGLIGLSLEYLLTKMLYSSKLSELAARLTHLEVSYEQIRLRYRELSLENVKTLHALADKQIREMVTARIMTKKRDILREAYGKDR